MLKLLTVVCFGTVAMSQMNNVQYVPGVLKQKDWISQYKPNAFFGTKNIGTVPVIHPSPIIQGDVIHAEPQNFPRDHPSDPSYAPSPNHVQPSLCENSEVLFKIWTILSKLLNTEEIQNPRIEKVHLALKLLKEYVETAPGNLRNDEVAKKLLTLEEALLKNKDNIPESKRAFRTIDDNIDTTDTVLTSSHRLPEKVKDPYCIEELARIIQTAQTSYVQLTQSPMCKGSLASPETFLRRSDHPFNLPQKQYKRANFNNIQSLNANNNEALKSSMGLLMNQSDYKANDVFELLQNFKPIQPTKSPPVDAVEPVVNDSKPFNPNQTEWNSKLLASAYNASQTSYDPSQLSDNVAINYWSNYSNATKIDPLNPNEIELTYALKRPQPFVYQPYYFIKYRLPFNSFLENLGKATQIKSRDTSKSELYKSVIQSWNADEISPGLAHYTKEQVNDLVIKEGNLVEALLIQSKDKNMRINLNTPENLQSQLSEYNFDKGDTKKGDGNHLVEAQASPYYSSDHNDESRRRNVESNLRPGSDTPQRFPSYPFMVQKGLLPTPLKTYRDYLLFKSEFGKTLPATDLPSTLIET